MLYFSMMFIASVQVYAAIWLQYVIIIVVAPSTWIQIFESYIWSYEYRLQHLSLILMQNTGEAHFYFCLFIIIIIILLLASYFHFRVLVRVLVCLGFSFLILPNFLFIQVSLFNFSLSYIKGCTVFGIPYMMAQPFPIFSYLCQVADVSIFFLPSCRRAPASHTQPCAFSQQFILQSLPPLSPITFTL